MYRGGYIYIMTNLHRNVLYIGVTSDLKKRVAQHRNHIYKNSFTDRYNLVYLIYYEGFNNIKEAIERETQIKNWSRKKKETIINTKNPCKRDLYDEIMNGVFSLL